MKQLILIYYCCLLLLFTSKAQEVVGIGISKPVGKLQIKATSDTTALVIQAFSTQSPRQPLLRLIKANGDSLLSIQSFNDNIWLGKYIGSTNANGYKNIYLGKYIDGATGTTPYLNIFIGDFAGEAVLNGYENIGIGNDVLRHQDNPINMVCIGSQAANILEPNANNTVAVGYRALHSDFGSGPNNTVIGANSMNKIFGANNTVAIGYLSVYGRVSDVNTGTLNTGIGALALYGNKNGSNNTAAGYNSMGNNYNGGYNTALGHNAFQSFFRDNITTDNVALGYQCLNTGAAGKNTIAGMEALYNSANGASNVAIGMRALYIDDVGSANVAVGYQALYSTHNSSYNTAVGSQSGDTYDNGPKNIFVGALTDANAAADSNLIAIGQGTIAATNTARFGNSSTISYGGWANWSNVSDGRFKTNVQENVPGLSFITRLRPVTYHLKAKALDNYLHVGIDKQVAEEARDVMNKAMAEKEQITYTGFIAQEVETAAKATGYDFSGVDIPKSAKEVYGLRYEEFVIPLVKAVQEQQQMLDTDDSRLTSLQQQLQALKARLKEKTK